MTDEAGTRAEESAPQRRKPYWRNPRRLNRDRTPVSLLPAASPPTQGEAGGQSRQVGTARPRTPSRAPRSRPAALQTAAPVPHYPVPTGHRPFSHSSEEDVASILDFYGVKWLYEPRSFPLRWDGNRVTEMFTPDFYLSELDLYLELTTMKQSLVTVKNRKLRRIRELYPEVNIRLLYRRDIYRLLAKYGFGPLVHGELPLVEEVLYSQPQIDRRVEELGKAITQDYAGQEIVLVGVLRGVFCFMADLMRQITLTTSVDFMSISRYSGAGSEGGVHITKGPDVALAGKHVVLVEDIVDTGMTLNYLLGYLQEQRPASLKVCALLDKRARRIADVRVDYVGFAAPDEFLVGYGLDYLERYRNLPFIGILRPTEKSPAEG